MATDATISADTANQFLDAWFVTVLVSALYLVFDGFIENLETVMKWGWVLVTLYIDPVGASI
ncbi:MAG: hypothetical protein ACTHQQ_11575 [Solirubrobacteraceae bacterium]